MAYRTYPTCLLTAELHSISTSPVVKALAEVVWPPIYLQIRALRPKLQELVVRKTDFNARPLGV